MLTYVKFLWNRLRSSFWFLPAVMTVGSLILSVISLAVDNGEYGAMVRDIDWAYDIGLEGSRLFLSTIAGSIITVTSLVFSLTLVALTLATSQLGPRLLNFFMRDMVTQMTMGLFLATFLFALLTMRAVSGEDSAESIPIISLSLAFGLTIVSFALLIYFIHHIAMNIQADNAVARVSASLQEALTCRDDMEGMEKAVPIEGNCDPEPRDGADAHTVLAAKSGYLQTADIQALFDLATEHKLHIALLPGVGDFIIRQKEVAFVSADGGPDGSSGGALPEDIDTRVLSALTLGPVRTPNQDVDYAVNGITEIAARALSSGINDYFTAVTCIDHLTDALALVLTSPPQTSRYGDDTGTERLSLNIHDFSDLIDAAFHPIRHNADGQFTILDRLSKAVNALRPLAGREEDIAALNRHRDCLVRAAQLQLEDEADQQKVLETLRGNTVAGSSD
jgi:uncharacterized membrane protein